MSSHFSARLCSLASLLLCACSLLAASAEQEQPAFAVYQPAPTKTLLESEVYTVFVRTPGSAAWQQVPVWNCEVDMHHRSTAAFAEFDMDSPVEVQVRLVKPSAMQADSLPPVVRPTERGIDFALSESGTVMQFRLDRPEYLSVEFGGDRHHNLHLFANPMLKETYTGHEPRCINWTGKSAQDVFVNGARLIYFGPGLHRPKDLPGEDIKIPSNCTVYLAPGSVVQARLVVDHAKNVRIIGRGILDHPLRGVEVTHSKNVLIDGITILNPRHYSVFGGASSGLTIRNVKSFSAGGWTDGFDLMSCSHVKIENVFLRNSDDCLAFYNHRWWYWGNTHDIDVRQAVLWCDFAHPVHIGIHGDDRCKKGEVLYGVNIEDCDVLRNTGDGILAINCGDNNTVRDIRFDHIRMEGIDRGRLTDMRVVFSGAYNRAPGNFIDRVTFSNISVDEASAPHMLPSRIVDYDSSHGVKRYSIEHVMYGNRPHDSRVDEQREQK
ncbi:MAG: glycosyl hydrolase family 28 protein [Alloprevotella sp.]